MRNNIDELRICRSCLEDQYLKDILNFKRGSKQTCSNCNKKKMCADYKSLALKLKQVISNHFSVVSEDGMLFELIEDYYDEGIDFKTTVRTILGHDIAEIDSIINYICNQDGWAERDGGVRFFEVSARFLRKTEYADELHHQWSDLVTEIKTKRRFFSDNARKLFESIFEGVENLLAYTPHKSGIGYSNLKKPVVHTISVGTKIFRARKCDSEESCKIILEDSEVELSPPPTKFAQQGRMNAKGVSVFYGAFDKKTCISEMRSSIGNYLVLGTFEPVRELRVLDFKLLESFVSKISYFQHDVKYQLKRRAFLHHLHSLISSPVISGHEDEYLITQVLAEYLAYVRPMNFDGISFESTQSRDGSNIILFPKEQCNGLRVSEPDHDDEIEKTQDVLEKFGLKFIKDSEVIYQTEKITYETKLISMRKF